MQNILITGGAGFIGVNFIRYVLYKTDFQGRVINVDKLTYAGNRLSLIDIESSFPDRYFFEHVDICDEAALRPVFDKYDIDTIVHFAAESHVDRSIFGPKDFIMTNVVGTFNLLECARAKWSNELANKRFHHISTDEVYGSIEEGLFREDTPYAPRSPYSASKAASDHLVMAYLHTYGLPVTMSNCSNNFGPYQFPEKLIPLMIINMLEEKPLPVYGDGGNVRDWLYVEDHCEAIWLILNKGRIGEAYNIGGGTQLKNIELVEKLCDIMDKKLNKGYGHFRRLITYVKDRPGHDRRYAIDAGKIKKELGWQPSRRFEEALETTVDWYLANRQWIEDIKSGDYLKWVEKNYGDRG